MTIEELAKELVDVSRGSLRNDTVILQLVNKLIDKYIELANKHEELEKRVRQIEENHEEGIQIQ